MAARFSAGEGTAITGQAAWARQYRLTRLCRRRPNVPRRPAPTTSLSPSRLAAPTGGKPGVDERQGGAVDAGQVRGLAQRGQVARTSADARDEPAGAGHAGLLGLIGTAAKRTPVLWTADAAHVVTR
jgi:hypothetical protein